MTETTEKQQTYEEMFADRFSSEDHEYQKYVNRPADVPPMVEDWRGRGGGHQRGRDNRYQDRRGHGGRGWGGDRGWRGDRGWDRDRGWRGEHHGQHHGQQQWQDRDRERDRDRNWGHGSGHQSSSNQAYNSHHQKPHYDRY
ncbi:RNA guanine-N7 methyltransferase activating subunit-like [Scomber japonicus]|uniref:RNA guanine-N7 methyltransferase activating subunit-like n=1 Tax=Scomber japonicus TaxID=13676 RepID=UPI0023068D11|nr:RNA guanine-N7 methyltransferase activating subunit-like [Scomber japonicus]